VGLKSWVSAHSKNTIAKDGLGANFPFCKKKTYCLTLTAFGKISVCLDGFGLQVFIYSLPWLLCSFVNLLSLKWFCKSLLG
jgi:hypothetical protein